MKHHPGMAIERGSGVGYYSLPRSPSAAPVDGRSLAGRASHRVSPRYKVSPMAEESKKKYKISSWFLIDCHFLF